MIDSPYYSSRKIPERCENSFVNYRMNYEKLCYLMRRHLAKSQTRAKLGSRQTKPEPSACTTELFCDKLVQACIELVIVQRRAP